MNGYAKVEFDAIELGENPRKSPRDIHALVESIRAVGLQTPLLVQYRHTTGKRTTDGKLVNSRYLLIDGYGRYEAIGIIRKAEGNKAFAEVPVVLAKCNDAEAEVLRLTANMAREDFGPVDAADGIKRLQNLGYKVRDIAQKIGRSLTWCSMLVKMRESLCSLVLDAIQDGGVSLSCAMQMLIIV